MRPPKYFNSAWDQGEPFPRVEFVCADPGDRAAVRLLLNLRAGMSLATPKLEGVILLGSAASYLLRIGRFRPATEN